MPYAIFDDEILNISDIDNHLENVDSCFVYIWKEDLKI